MAPPTREDGALRARIDEGVALGARRVDIMAQMLTESVVLSIFGGVAWRWEPRRGRLLLALDTTGALKAKAPGGTMIDLELRVTNEFIFINQTRLRLEREVDQLNFNDFVASGGLNSAGGVTAGNASGINDGAAGLIIMSDTKTTSGKIEKSEAEWRRELTPMQYAVLREKATERPFSGEYEHEQRRGTGRAARGVLCTAGPRQRSGQHAGERAGGRVRAGTPRRCARGQRRCRACEGAECVVSPCRKRAPRRCRASTRRSASPHRRDRAAHEPRRAQEHRRHADRRRRRHRCITGGAAVATRRCQCHQHACRQRQQRQCQGDDQPLPELDAQIEEQERSRRTVARRRSSNFPQMRGRTTSRSKEVRKTRSRPLAAKKCIR